MVRTVPLIAAVLAIAAVQSAGGAEAADLARHRPLRHRHDRLVRERYVEQNKVIRCTTTSVLGLFTTSNCGEGFDPLGVASN